MLIFDAHLDLSWNAVGWNRDLLLSVEEIRLAEAHLTEKGRGTGTVSLPALREGRVAISIATVLARANRLGTSSIDFRNQEIAFAVAQGQLAYYRILQSQGVCRMIRTLAQLQASVSEWTEDADSAKFGFVLSMEGADPIVSPAQVPQWWDDGLRLVGMAHYGPSAYAHGTGCEGGLTAKAPDLLRAMAECGIILDLTHLADQSFWEALKLWKGPVIASHNNCRTLVPGDRQYSDDQIRAIIERGGVIGAAFDAWMLTPGWKSGSQRPPLESVVDHMDHICQLAGNAEHIAIGSDLDGGFGTEQCPQGLDTIADLRKIPAILKDRGYSDADILATMNGNWLNLFERAWQG
jgi:membrane dipeptidase